MGIWDIWILLIVAAVVVIAVLWRKRSGKPFTCDGSCGSCRGCSGRGCPRSGKERKTH